MRDRRVLVALLVTLATFADLLAYTVAVPVLPDLASRLGATPTTVGLLFGAFGVTLLAVSIPTGMLSDRIGRRAPMALGMLALAGATVAFAFSRDLPALFAARLVQGAADGITWVVGLALVADLYGPEERGRAMGFVMSGTSLGVILGPPLGGWLYETGGVELPFLVVAGLAGALGLAFLTVPMAPGRSAGSRVPLRRVLTLPAVLACVAAAVAGSATYGMLEPVLPLHLQGRLGFSPRDVGLVFGAAAVASTLAHPLWGRLSDRWGGFRLMVTGLALAAGVLPLLSLAGSAAASTALAVLLWPALGMTVTPALALLAQATAAAELEAHGAAYGVYNVAWGVGLLVGPAAGGFLLEHLGFGPLSLVWAAVLLAAAVGLAGLARPRDLRDRRVGDVDEDEEDEEDEDDEGDAGDQQP